MRSRLTADIQERICKAILVGMNWKQAAAVNGIHRRTIERWRAKGEAEDGTYTRNKYGKFLKSCDVAKAECEQLCLMRIAGAASRQVVRERYDAQGNLVERIWQPAQWTAAAWMLERIWPERYGRRLNVTSDEPIRHQITYPNMDAVQLASTRDDVQALISSVSGFHESGGPPVGKDNSRNGDGGSGLEGDSV